MPSRFGEHYGFHVTKPSDIEGQRLRRADRGASPERVGSREELGRTLGAGKLLDFVKRRSVRWNDWLGHCSYEKLDLGSFL